MAHKRALSITCQFGACTSSARWEVFNLRNAPCGRYCTRHANETVRRLEAAELRTRESAPVERLVDGEAIG